MPDEFGGRCRSCSGYVVAGRCMVCSLTQAAPAAEADADGEAPDETQRTLDVCAGLLTRTANALKGEPSELLAWSWHDLPALAGRLRAFAEEAAADGCFFGDGCTTEAQLARQPGRCRSCSARAALAFETSAEGHACAAP